MELVKSNSPVALYYQLKEILSDKILSNEWSLGERLPTEFELCEQYGVSRITVRQALAELEREGLIVRKQGLGTFVSFPKIEQTLASFYSFTEGFRKRGLVPRNEVVDFEIKQADAKAQKIFGLTDKSLIYSFTRLRLASDLPIAIESTYLPVDLFPGLTKKELAKSPLYEIMSKRYGVVANSAEESFGAVALGRKEAKIFGLKEGAAALDLERLAYNASRCVEYTRGVVRGDKFRFQVKLD
ncbi:MAG TPA: GntR family transcriptional regulator [Firmicutes bacterium]|nr:GntR family transcriptional regulator [Bacillota bacterium]